MTTTNAKLISNTFGGIRGVTSTFNDTIITASDMQNVELYNTGINGGVGIRTMLGNKSISKDLPDDEKIINIFESTQLGKKYIFIHTENSIEGKIYRFNFENGNVTLMRDLLGITGFSCGLDFAQGDSDLFIFSTSEEMLIIEMNSDEQVIDYLVEDIDGVYLKASGFASYDSRLWLFNKNKLWYSVQNNIYDFKTSDAELKTSSGYIFYGKTITAITPYLGSLAIFFFDSSIVLSGEFPYSQSEESPGGCANQNSFVFHGTELYFFDYSKKGIYSFKQVVLGDKTLGNNIAVEIQNELFNIDFEKLKNIRALSVMLSQKNEIWFLLPTLDENYSTILIYDYIHNEWIKRKSQKIYSIAIVNDFLVSGSHNGKILLEYSGQTFDGSFIEHFYHCTPFNLGSETTLKVLYFPPRVAVEGSNYCNSFYVKYIKNYDTSRPKIKLIKSRFGRFLFWDIGFWDINYWASNILRFIKKLPSATFKTLQIIFYTTNQAQDFCIKSIEFSRIKVKQI